MIKLSNILKEIELDPGTERVLVLEVEHQGHGDFFPEHYYYTKDSLYDVIKRVTQEYLENTFDNTPFEQLNNLIEAYEDWGGILINKKKTIGATILPEEGDGFLFISNGDFLFISNRDHRFLEKGSSIQEYVNLTQDLIEALDENDIEKLPLPIPEEYLDND